MIRRLVPFVLAFALAIGIPLTISHKTDSRPAQSRYHKAQQQTVLLKGKTGQASGFVVIRKNALGQERVFIWTAAHVIDEEPELQAIRIYHFNGHKAGYAVFQARTVAFSKKHDLALMLVDCPPNFFTNAEFARSGVGLGDRVFVVGNALGEMFDGSVTQGTISQVGVRPFDDRDWPWGCDLDQTTAIIVPGNSGGPVYNDKGQVVGIAVGWARLPRVGVFVPVREILSWAKEAGVYWAVEDYGCPSDKLLEGAIAVTIKLLTPPPRLHTPDSEPPGCSG